jgi:hypothetical protein
MVQYLPKEGAINRINRNALVDATSLSITLQSRGRTHFFALALGFL